MASMEIFAATGRGFLSKFTALHEVGFTRKLKPYFSKTDFAVWVCKNEKYRTASDLAFPLNATG